MSRYRNDAADCLEPQAIEFDDVLPIGVLHDVQDNPITPEGAD